MITYRCFFVFSGGVLWVTEMRVKSDGLGDDQVDAVCELLADKLGADYVRKEVVS